MADVQKGVLQVAGHKNLVIFICMMTQINKDEFLAESSDTACYNLGGLLEPRFFRALGDPNRVAILARLIQCCRPCSVSEIGEDSPISISVVSRHLAMLRDAGILSAEKDGRVVRYSVQYPELVRTLRALADAIASCCPAETPVSSGVNKNSSHDNSHK